MNPAGKYTASIAWLFIQSMPAPDRSDRGIGQRDICSWDQGKVCLKCEIIPGKWRIGYYPKSTAETSHAHSWTRERFGRLGRLSRQTDSAYKQLGRLGRWHDIRRISTSNQSLGQKNFNNGEKKNRMTRINIQVFTKAKCSKDNLARFLHWRMIESRERMSAASHEEMWLLILNEIIKTSGLFGQLSTKKIMKLFWNTAPCFPWYPNMPAHFSILVLRIFMIYKLLNLRIKPIVTLIQIIPSILVFSAPDPVEHSS